MRVVDFLKLHKYPTDWTLEDLDECLVVRVFDETGTIGYFWAHWIANGLLAFHVCVADGKKVRWWNSSTLRQLYQIAFILGADDLATAIEDSAENSSRIRSLLLRLGFTETIHDDETLPFYTLNIWEALYGLQEHQGEDRAGSPKAHSDG